MERRVCFLNAVLALSRSLQTVKTVLWNEAVFGHYEERMSWIRGSRRRCGNGVRAKIFKSQLAENLLTNATAVMILDGVMKLIMNNQHTFFSQRSPLNSMCDLRSEADPLLLLRFTSSSTWWGRVDKNTRVFSCSRKRCSV